MRRGIPPFLLLVYLVLHSPPAMAERLSIWGIIDKCNHADVIERSLDKHLYQAALDPWLLSPEPSSCHGVECVNRVKAACPALTGRVLGGHVFRTRTAKGLLFRLRLWLTDLGTNQTAYGDEYCIDCALDTLVQQAAKRLLERPSFGVVPGPTPLYCQPGSELPAQACEPLDRESCGESSNVAAATATAPPPSVSGVDPKLATLVKGGLWGLFAGTAATSLGLFIANGTSAGTILVEDTEQRNVFTRPAWSMAAVAGVTLALAVPITLQLNKAGRSGGGTTGPQPAPIRCPN